MIAAPLSDDDCAQLAALHVSLLPDSAVARLGVSYAARFWRYAWRSALESMLVEREDGRIVAAGLLSFSTATLGRRLLLSTPLLLALLRHPRLALEAVGGSGPADELPELLILMTDRARQGRGLGRAMLANAEAELRRRGHSTYVVRSFADETHPAVRFYKANGFVPHARFCAHGSEFLLLRKSLESAPGGAPAGTAPG
jgi:GNAT superfamily N-acetyltransferase